MIVIDASATGALILEDERSPPDDIADALSTGPLIAPAHWPTEVANMVLVAERRRRIPPSDRRIVFGQVLALRVSVQRDDERAIWERGMAIASKHGLTIYDAAYLELAIRLGARLATLDGDLMAAAPAYGVAILSWKPS